MNTGRFELERQIGAGGMGAVWKGRDAETARPVALKFIHPMVASDPEYVRRFENEVEAARRIRSPHVVQVYGYGRREGQPFLAMEYVEGESLAELLDRRKTLTWDEARPIALAVAKALQAAHAAGVIHRDVKPSNILIDQRATTIACTGLPAMSVKLADFGIARTSDLTQLTQGPIGTLAYMAPDQEASPSSDLYALGCVLFEMLVGRPPFTGTTITALLKAHALQKPALHLVPAPARALVRDLLAKKPAQRPQSAAAVVAILEGTAKPPSGFTSRVSAETAIRAAVRAQSEMPFWLRLGIAVGVSITAYSIRGL